MSFVVACRTLSCSMWDLVLGPRIRHPALGVQSLSHWTSSEVPVSCISIYTLATTAVTDMVSKDMWPTGVCLSPRYGSCPIVFSQVVPFITMYFVFLGLPRWLSGKLSICKAGDIGSIPGKGRSPGEGIGNPLQYSCPGNPMDRGAWWARVHGVAKSQTWPSD